uniref:Uncharacterized protein n=1 Tax=Trichogramma kaykai TaxID=54128 RepID=A0ABD2W9E4_9HYME
MVQGETQFALADVTVELTKYHHVISQMNVRAASEEHSVRQLLHDEELGDRKPSQFPQHLKSLTAPVVVYPIYCVICGYVYLRMYRPS